MNKKILSRIVIALVSIAFVALAAGAIYLYIENTKTETLKTPANARIEQRVFKWEAVDNATSYRVSINSEYKIVPNTETSYSLTYLKVSDTYTLKVQAIGFGDKYKNSNFSNAAIYTINPEPLSVPDVEKVNEDGGYLKWDTVPNAVGYDIYVNNKFYSHTSDTEFSIAEFNIPGENYTIAVVAKGDDLDTSDSPVTEDNTFEITNPTSALPKPVIHFDESTETLSWDKIDEAVCYDVFVWNEVKGKFDFVVCLTLSQTSYQLEDLIPGETYKFAVSAKGNDENYTMSELSDPAIYNKPTEELPTPNIWTINDMGDEVWIEWEEIDNAVGYQLWVRLSDYLMEMDSYGYLDSYNNWYCIYENEDTTFDLATWSDYNFPGTTYEFIVVAIGNQTNYTNSDSNFDYLSNYSIHIQPLVLDAPTPVYDESQDILRWNEVQNAEDYLIIVYKDGYFETEINEPFEQEEGGMYISVKDFNFPGTTYDFYVIALGNGVNYLDSNYELDILDCPFDTKTTEREQLAAPVISVEYEDEDYVRIVWDYIDFAEAYAIYVDGTYLETTIANNFEFVIAADGHFMSGGTYAVTVVAVGNPEKVDESDPSNVLTLEIDLSELEIPTGLMITRGYDGDEQKGYFSWDEVVSEYHTDSPVAYEIMFDGNDGDIIACSDLVFDLDLDNVGDHYIQVRAVGNTTTTKSSEWSETFYYTVLETPNNINEDINQLQINWENNQYATGYNVYILDQDRNLVEMLYLDGSGSTIYNIMTWYENNGYDTWYYDNDFIVEISAHDNINYQGNNVVFESPCSNEMVFASYDIYFRYENQGTITITGIKMPLEEVCIPYDIAGTQVVGIGDNAFTDNSSIRIFRLNSSITEFTIGNSAFDGCLNLEMVEFNFVERLTLGEMSFANINNNNQFQTIMFKNEMQALTISSGAFYNTILEYFEFPSQIDDLIIGKSAFDACSITAHMNVSIYNNLYGTPFGSIYIEETAFAGLNINNIEIRLYADKIYIGEEAFSGISTSNHIFVEIDAESTLEIGDRAFFDFSNIQDVTLHVPMAYFDSLDMDCFKFGRDVFEGTAFCVNGMEGELIYIMDARSGDRYLYGINWKDDGMPWDPGYQDPNQRMTSIVVDARMVLPYAFYESNFIDAVDFIGCEIIGEYAFYNCMNIAKINLYDLRSIGDYAFDGEFDNYGRRPTWLSVIIGYNIQYIGERAFGGAQQEQKIYVREYQYSFESRVNPGADWSWMATVIYEAIDIPDPVQPVTGINYDPYSNRITWDSMPGFKYYYSIKAVGEDTGDTQNGSIDLGGTQMEWGRMYVFSITAVDLATQQSSVEMKFYFVYGY